MALRYYTLIGVILFSCSGAHARDWFVDASDCSGDGTRPELALCTIQEGIDAASADGGGEVAIAAGVYPEFLELFENVKLRGAQDETIIVEYPGSVAEEAVLVRMAEDTNIDNITFQVPEDTDQIVVLIRINNVKVELEDVVLDGGMSRGSVGIFVSGPDSSQSRVKKSIFRNLEVGIIAQNTEMRITRNLFTDILRDAVFVRLPPDVVNTAGILMPEIGDDDLIEFSGFNRFRNIGGFGTNVGDSFLVRNSTGIALVAQVNDWGVFDRAIIVDRLSTVDPLTDVIPVKARKGPSEDAAIFEPFIGKSIIPNSIFVRLLDQSTGLAIPQVANPTVGIEPGGGEPTPVFDDESGLIILSPLLPRTYTLTATADGFDPLIAVVELDPGELEALVMSLFGEGTTPPPSPFQCDAGFHDEAGRGHSADVLLITLVIVALLCIGRSQKRIS